MSMILKTVYVIPEIIVIILDMLRDHFRCHCKALEPIFAAVPALPHDLLQNVMRQYNRLELR
ncbi:MAG: hypothetical protein ACOYYU_01770 [Chloroflexota bacterium]